jgi:tape measure domain-containing protein
MADKVLRIKIESIYSGEDALQKLNNNLDLSQVKLKKLATTNKEVFDANGNVITTFNHSIELSSDKYKDLTANIKKANAALIALNNSGKTPTVTQTPLLDKSQQFKTGLLEAQLKQQSQITIANAQAEGNKILEVRVKLAEQERQLARTTAAKLQAIEKEYSAGRVNFINQAAQRNTALADQQAQILAAQNTARTKIALINEIKQAEIAAYKEGATRAKQAADAIIAAKKRELEAFRSGNVPTTANRALQIQAANLVGGTRGTLQEAELRSTHAIEDIRRHHAEVLVRIERQLANNLITLAQARTRREQAVANLQTNIAAQQRAIADIRTNNALVEANNRAAASYRSLAQRVFEVVGLYRIYNAVVNNVVAALQGIPKAGIELETTKAVLTATTGSAAGAAATFAFLTKEAERTGIAIGTVRETFRNFYASTSIAGESLETTTHIFQNVNTVIAGLHLPAAKAEGIFNALAQIFNKTKVQSEELVKQLGNLLPGAFAAFAKANNLTTLQLVKDMKAGVVLAHDTIEKFTAFYAERFQAAAQLANTGLNANIGRLQTSFTLLQEQLYKTSQGSIIATVKGLTNLLKAIKEDSEGANILGAALKGLGLILGGVVLTHAGKTALAFAASGRAVALFNKSLVVGVVTAYIAVLEKLYNKVHQIPDAIKSTDSFLKDFYDKQVEKTPEQKIKIAVDEDPGIVANLKLLKENFAALTEAGNQLKTMRLFGTGFDNEEIQAQSSLVNKLTADQEALANALHKARLSVKASLEEQAKLNAKPPIDFAEDLEKASLNYEKMDNAAIQYGKQSAASYKEAQKIIENAKGLVLGRAVVIPFKPQEDYVPKVPFKRPENFNALELQEALKFVKLRDEKIAALELEGKAKAQQARDDANNIKLAKQRDFNVKAIEDETSSIVKRLEIEKAAYEQQIKLAEINKSPFSQETATETLKSFDQDILKAKEKGLARQIALQKELTTLTTLSNESSLSTADKVEAVWRNILKLETGGIREKDKAGAISPTGALGRVQIQPSTLAAYQTIPDNVLRAEQVLKDTYKGRNVPSVAAMRQGFIDQLRAFALANEDVINASGKKYFQTQIDTFKGDLAKGAAAYNAGPGAVRKFERKAEREGTSFLATLPTTGDAKDRVGNYANAAVNIGASSITRSSELAQQAREQVIKLEQDKKTIVEQSILDINKYELDQAQLKQDRLAQIRDIDQALAAQVSSEKEQAINQINIDYENKRAELESKGNVEGLARLELLKKEQLVQANITELKRQYALNEEKYSKRSEELTRQVQIGQIDQVAATKRIIEEQNIYLKAQDDISKKWAEQVEQSGNVASNIDLINAKSERTKALQEQAVGLFIPDTGEFGQLAREKDTGSAQIDQQANAQRQLNSDTYSADLQAQHLVVFQAAKEAELQIVEATNQKKLNLELSYYQALAGISSSNLDNISEGVAAVFGKQSAAAKAAFIVSRGAAIAEATINAYLASSKAFAQGGILGAITGGIALASGLATVAKIASTPMPQAHGGLDYVPENNKTFVLSKGERVLKPEQNKDLTGYLKEAKMNKESQQNTKQTNNIRIVNAIDPNVFGDYLGTSDGEQVVMNIVRRNRGALA